VEDESAAGGKQKPLRSPVRTRGRPAEQEEEDSEEEEEEDEAAGPARPGQAQKLPRYLRIS